MKTERAGSGPSVQIRAPPCPRRGRQLLFPGFTLWPAVPSSSIKSRLVEEGTFKVICVICVGPARSAPRLCAHLRRSAFPLLLLGPNEDHGGIFAPGRGTRNGNSHLTTAFARRETREATANHGMTTA